MSKDKKHWSIKEHKNRPIGVTEDAKPILSWDSIFRIQDRMEKQAREQQKENKDGKNK